MTRRTNDTRSTALARALRSAIVALALLGTTASAHAQPASDVLHAVDHVFAAMAARDTTALRTLLAPDLVIVSTVQSGAQTGTRRQTVPDFLHAVAASPQTLHERMWNPTVHVDGGIATVWTPYTFHRDAAFSHCGHDSFTLARMPNGWVVTSLAYTVQQTGCDAVVDTTGAAARIRAARTAFNDAIARRDTIAIGSFLLPTYHIVTGRSAQTAGGDAARHDWAHGFGTDSVERYVRTPREIRVNDVWGFAEELGDWDGRTIIAGSVAHVTGSYAAKWHRGGDGGWKLQAEVFTLLHCDAPGRACDPPARR